jgi:uncharacterized beta-barrel protein YwiB (DUF1934 family)
MLLKELMELTNINLSLSDIAQNIEIHDDFKNNPIVSINETEITIICSGDNITRAVNFNFDKNTITEIFSSPFGTGGEVHSMNGDIIKILN